MNQEADDRLRLIVEENAQINSLLKAQHEASSSNLHQPIQRFAKLVTRPQFIIVCLIVFVLWIVVNTELLLTEHSPWDAPPFFWLQGLISAFSLIITTTVLVSQSRQAQLAEQRADVQLQVVLLIGQRTAKLIELAEELRRDLPNVRDRRDEQAEVLQQVMTPDGILEALEVKKSDNAT